MYYQPKYEIPIKKYQMDESKSWEERYHQLHQHHQEETTLLIAEMERLRKIINDQVDYEVERASRKGYPWD